MTCVSTSLCLCSYCFLFKECFSPSDLPLGILFLSPRLSISITPRKPFPSFIAKLFMLSAVSLQFVYIAIISKGCGPSQDGLNYSLHRGPPCQILNFCSQWSSFPRYLTLSRHSNRSARKEGEGWWGKMLKLQVGLPEFQLSRAALLINTPLPPGGTVSKLLVQYFLERSQVPLLEYGSALQHWKARSQKTLTVTSKVLSVPLYPSPYRLLHTQSKSWTFISSQ